MNPIENMTLREIFRSRPLAIGILEELSGSIFWGRLDTGLAAFCKDSNLDLTQIQARFATLPDSSERQNWKDLPLYFVVDHLTAEHQLFRSRDLPEIHRLLDSLKQEVPDSSGPLENLISEFKDFRKDLSWHMEEEEEFIFPKILRTEASLRHPELYPEVFKGSIKMFSSIQLHGPEESFHEFVSGISVTVRRIVSDNTGLPLCKDTLNAIQAFEARLRAHTYIESEILFRKAIEIEDSLLRRVA